MTRTPNTSKCSIPTSPAVESRSTCMDIPEKVGISNFRTPASAFLYEFTSCIRHRAHGDEAKQNVVPHTNVELRLAPRQWCLINAANLVRCHTQLSRVEHSRNNVNARERCTKHCEEAYLEAHVHIPLNLTRNVKGRLKLSNEVAWAHVKIFHVRLVPTKVQTPGKCVFSRRSSYFWSWSSPTKAPQQKSLPRPLRQD